MTTQSPHLGVPSSRSTVPGAGRAARVQTRLPWWALALPAVAFATLLGLLSAGPADASAPTADTLVRLAAVLGHLLDHLT